MKHGMSAETPVGMVRWGTTGRQQSIEGKLGNIAKIAKALKTPIPKLLTFD